MSCVLGVLVLAGCVVCDMHAGGGSHMHVAGASFPAMLLWYGWQGMYPSTGIQYVVVTSGNRRILVGSE